MMHPVHRWKKRRYTALLAMCAGLFWAPSTRGLTIAISHTGGASADMLIGMNTAASIWESYIDAPGVTVNIDFAGAALAPGVLGSASSTKTTQTWVNTRNALIANASSADDTTAVSNLPGAGGINMLMNWTTESGTSSTPYLDNNGSANNTNLNMTTANAKALGLIDPAAGTDASITFSTNFGQFDFNRGDSIDAGSIDFVGVAIHEIGHALGFTSVVDLLDYNHGFAEDLFMPSVVDIYRYSSDSAAQNAIDLSVLDEERYLSIDGGTSYLNTLERAFDNQASHWRDNTGAGLMDPTAAWGTQLDLTSDDLRLFDLIGWGLTGSGSALSALAGGPTPIPLGAGAGGGAPEPKMLGLLVILVWVTYSTTRLREEAR